MKRIAWLITAWGLVLLAPAPLAGDSYQVASVDPPSGPGGTDAIFTVSGSRRLRRSGWSSAPTV